MFKYLTKRDVDDSTRFKAASMLIRHDQDSGLRLLAEFSKSPEIKPEIRLNSAIELWRHDKEWGFRTLTSLAEDRQFNSMLRIKAAYQVSESHLHDGLEVLLRLTVDSSMAEEARIPAGRAAGKLEPVRGARALSQLVDEQQLSSTTQLNAALAALDFDSSQGLSALIKLASPKFNTTVRLRAAKEVADRDPVKGGNLLLTLAKDERLNIWNRAEAAQSFATKCDLLRGIAELTDLARDRSTKFETKLDIASRVSRLDPVAGSKLIAEFANSTTLPVAQQISAAKLLGGVRAADILASMSEKQQLADTDRLAAALAALEIDRSRGLHALIKLANARIEPTVRLDATKAVAGHNRSEALKLYMAFSKERSFGDKNRFTAAEAAARINPKRGLEAFTEIANDTRVSQSIRRKADEAAQRLS